MPSDWTSRAFASTPSSARRSTTVVTPAAARLRYPASVGAAPRETRSSTAWKLFTPPTEGVAGERVVARAHQEAPMISTLPRTTRAASVATSRMATTVTGRVS